MSSSTRSVRIIFIVVLAVVFSVAAFYLFQKQKEKYSFSSFRIENESASLMIPNMDRLCDKISSPDDLQIQGLPEDLVSGIKTLIAEKNFLFSEEISPDCFISFNTTDFSIAFETSDVDAFSLAELIKLKLQRDCSAGENSIELNGKKYHAQNFNQFLVISTIPVSAISARSAPHYCRRISPSGLGRFYFGTSRSTCLPRKFFRTHSGLFSRALFLWEHTNGNRSSQLF